MKTLRVRNSDKTAIEAAAFFMNSATQVEYFMEDAYVTLPHNQVDSFIRDLASVNTSKEVVSVLDWTTKDFKNLAGIKGKKVTRYE